MLENVDSIEELFELWQKAHREESERDYFGTNIPKGAFLPDGIIDYDKYKKSNIKVLLIAKEANWYLKDKEYDEKMGFDMFWHREVAFGNGNVHETQFSKRLSMLANAVIKNDYKTVNKSHEALKSVAVMNLNKRGGYAYCVWDTLNTYVKKYRCFIKREIELLNPDIIVCCGYDVKWLLDEYNIVSNETKKVWVYHPSYFAISDADYLEQLRCAVNGEYWNFSKKKATIVASKAINKGIVFDTNKTYSDISTMDMLLGNKVSAYDDASNLVDSFNIGDFVFFSVRGAGVVAVGRIVSDTEKICYPEFLEKYRVVDFIVPSAEKMPHGEDDLKALSWKRITSILGHGFYYARTDKRPYLLGEECEVLIKELHTLYEND